MNSNHSKPNNGLHVLANHLSFQVSVYPIYTLLSTSVGWLK